MDGTVPAPQKMRVDKRDFGGYTANNISRREERPMIRAALSCNGMNYNWDVNYNGSDFSYMFQAAEKDA